MSKPRQDYTAKRGASGGNACPKCGGAVAADANRCLACGFTGADTMVMFPDPPPPLLPVLDAAALWNDSDVRSIEAAREKLRRRFPQLRFHVCSVALPASTSLPAFGFWLLNACPFYVNETAAERAWAVMLLVNAASGQAAVVPGYAAERWLDDADWSKVLASMSTHWKAGRHKDAVLRFFETSAPFLEQSWKVRGLRKGKRAKP
jgi:hypothetical protein